MLYTWLATLTKHILVFSTYLITFITKPCSPMSSSSWPFRMRGQVCYVQIWNWRKELIVSDFRCLVRQKVLIEDATFKRYPRGSLPSRKLRAWQKLLKYRGRTAGGKLRWFKRRNNGVDTSDWHRLLQQQNSQTRSTISLSTLHWAHCSVSIPTSYVSKD